MDAATGRRPRHRFRRIRLVVIGRFLGPRPGWPEDVPGGCAVGACLGGGLPPSGPAVPWPDGVAVFRNPPPGGAAGAASMTRAGGSSGPRGCQGPDDRGGRRQMHGHERAHACWCRSGEGGRSGVGQEPEVRHERCEQRPEGHPPEEARRSLRAPPDRGQHSRGAQGAGSREDDGRDGPRQRWETPGGWRTRPGRASGRRGSRRATLRALSVRPSGGFPARCPGPAVRSSARSLLGDLPDQTGSGSCGRPGVPKWISVIAFRFLAP